MALFNKLSVTNFTASTIPDDFVDDEEDMGLEDDAGMGCGKKNLALQDDGKITTKDGN